MIPFYMNDRIEKGHGRSFLVPIILYLMAFTAFGIAFDSLYAPCWPATAEIPTIDTVDSIEVQTMFLTTRKRLTVSENHEECSEILKALSTDSEVQRIREIKEYPKYYLIVHQKDGSCRIFGIKVYKDSTRVLDNDLNLFWHVHQLGILNRIHDEYIMK